jgi:hypothetical protein
MKRNFIISLLGSFIGFGILIILLSATGSVGVRSVAARLPAAQYYEASAATPLTSTFTYAGQLKNGGTAVTAVCQMAFRLYDDPFAPINLIGSPITTSVPVTTGLFSVGLNFGDTAFNGSNRWLDLQVNCTGTFVPLTPREAVTAAPYALFAASAGALQNYPIALTAPSAGQVLKWTGSAWAPGSSGSYSNGFGLDLNSTVFSVLTDTIQARVTASCSAGNAIRVVNQDGSVACEPVTGGGTISNVIAGAGLIGGGASGAISLTVDFAGSGSASTAARSDHTHAGEDISSGTVADARIAASIARVSDITPTILANDGPGSGLDADLLDGQPASAFVSTSGNQTISGTKIFSDGIKFADGTTQTTAFTGTSPAPALNHPPLPGAGAAATADSAGNVGQYSSITIGADGLGLISHYDATGVLMVLHCGNAACNSGNTSTILDNIGDAGQYSSIAIGQDGLGLISYYADAPDNDLRVLHCGNVLCNSNNTATIVDSGGDVGKFSSITIGADGLGLISYYADSPNFDLKVFHCTNVLCNSGSATTVNLTGDVGQYSSITIGADGLGLVSYYDNSAHALKVLHCGNLTCNSGSSLITVVDNASDVGQYSSITLGSDGLGLISYWDATYNDLKVLHCGSLDCSSGYTATAVNVTGNVGQYSSITIGGDGLGLVSYYDATAHALKVLHCGNLTCNSGSSSITIVDNAGNVGKYSSITLDADGLGLISYYDVVQGDLKVFRCSNVTCTPYTRVGR